MSTHLDVAFQKTVNYLKMFLFGVLPFELKREKKYLLTCAPNEDSKSARDQPDLGLRCPHEETLHPWLSKMRPVKILIRLIDITKTCLYNFDPLKPHFYIVKLGFTEVYIIFLIFAQNYRLCVLVRTASARRF